MIETPDYIPAKKKASNFWATASRLMGYAFRHKFKMLMLVGFSFISAGSMSSMLVGAVFALEVTYAGEEEAQKIINGYVEAGTIAADKINERTGWRPDVEPFIVDTLTNMRETPGFALRCIAAMIIVITLIGGTSRFIQEYYAGVVGAHIVMDLRQDMYDSIISLSHDFFEQRASGVIMSRFTNDVTMVNTGLLNVFIFLFRDPIRVIGPLTIAFLTSWKMLVLILVFMSPLIVLFAIVGM